MTIAGELKRLQETRSELERVRQSLSNTLLGEGHIVQCDAVYITYDVEKRDGHYVAINPRSSPPHLCRRFTQRDAEAIAATTKNGAGTVATAIHVADAVRAYLADIESVIADFERHLAKKG